MSSHLGRRNWRRTALALATVGLTGAGLGTVTALPAQAAPQGTLTDFGFDAASYGSKTTGNENAASGATALSVLPCTRYVPRSSENFIEQVGDGDGVELTNAHTRNFTEVNGGQTAVISRVEISNGTLAGGEIAFTNLVGRVKSYHGAAGFRVDTTSSLGSLSIGGVPVPLPIGDQETAIPVPGAGTLYVNRQVSRANQVSATGGVNVMRFVGDDGTVEKVGRAFSRIDGNIEGGLFKGSAWGSDARTGDLAALGRAALQPMPCPGTRGNVLETRTGRLDTAFGFIGARYSAVMGEQHANNSASGYTRSVIDRAGFNGVLAFRNIEARANVTRQADGDVVRNAKGTDIGQILVNGQPIAQPLPGESRNVAGVGRFTVKTVQKSPIGIDVTAVTVQLFNGTPKNLSDDTVVHLGRAKLAIKRG